MRGCFRHWKHTARLRVRVYGQLFIELSLTADTAEKELVRDVNEKLCYIALDYDTELNSTAETDNFTTFEFPDGTSSPSAQIFPLPQVLFQPSFLGKEPAASTTLTPATICTSMSSGILFRRIVERMTKEIDDGLHVR